MLRMKKSLILGFIVLTLAAFGATRALAYNNWHDDKHWYDKAGHSHNFVKHNGHHGYWDTDSGAKVFEIAGDEEADGAGDFRQLDVAG